MIINVHLFLVFTDGENPSWCSTLLNITSEVVARKVWLMMVITQKGRVTGCYQEKVGNGLKG